MHLHDQNMQLDHSIDGENGLEKTLSIRYDLIILDLMLPGIDGIEICRRLRSQDNYTPILMLTARNTELDRVLGLEMGADDYLTKPFSISELIARVKAIFRRIDAYSVQGEAKHDGPLSIGDLVLNPDKRSVKLHDNPLDLTAKEFDLLWHFASHPGRVYTRTQLLDHVWGYGHEGYEHTVNSHINRLRAKIEADPANPRYVITVWGVGYKFNEPELLSI
jgi:DNA-binding response OmpR family regulator